MPGAQVPRRTRAARRIRRWRADAGYGENNDNNRHGQLRRVPLHRLRHRLPGRCFHGDEKQLYIDNDVCINAARAFRCARCTRSTRRRHSRGPATWIEVNASALERCRRSATAGVAAGPGAQGARDSELACMRRAARTTSAGGSRRQRPAVYAAEALSSGSNGHVDLIDACPRPSAWCATAWRGSSELKERSSPTRSSPACRCCPAGQRHRRARRHRGRARAHYHAVVFTCGAEADRGSAFLEKICRAATPRPSSSPGHTSPEYRTGLRPVRGSGGTSWARATSRPTSAAYSANRRTSCAHRHRRARARRRSPRAGCGVHVSGVAARRRRSHEQGVEGAGRARKLAAQIDAGPWS